MERMTIKGFNFTSDFVASNLQSFPIAEALKKLQSYEDAEEQGRLIVLPCKVGDTVFMLNYNHKCSGCPDNKVGKCKLYSGTCDRKSEYKITETVFDFNDFSYQIVGLKSNLYLTREEAEAALEKMEESKWND